MTTIRQIRNVLTLLLALAVAGQSAQSGELVRVGAYPFLPFVDPTGGLTADLVQAMNAFQKDYTFQLVNTSSKRRYRDMATNMDSPTSTRTRSGSHSGSISASAPTTL